MTSLRSYLWFVPLSVFLLVIAFVGGEHGDYVKYYRCGEAAFISGQNPYLVCKSYVQVPPVLFLMAPFALLPPPFDLWLWSVIVVACVVGALGLFTHTFRLYDEPSQRYLALLILSPLGLFLVLFQQLSAVIFLLEAVIFWALASKRVNLAALMVALSVIKPHLTIFLAPLLAAAGYKAQTLAVGVGGAILAIISWPYIGYMWQSWNTANDSDAGTHSTVAIRELLPGGTMDWNVSTVLITLIPLTYVIWLSYRLLRRGSWDMVLVAKLLVAGLLWLPYNRAYDWVLTIPAYLIAWEAAGRQWTPGLRLAVALAWIALPVSTATYFMNIPFSINPLPLILLAVSLWPLPEGSVVLGVAQVKTVAQWSKPARIRKPAQ